MESGGAVQSFFTLCLELHIQRLRRCMSFKTVVHSGCLTVNGALWGRDAEHVPCLH